MLGSVMRTTLRDCSWLVAAFGCLGLSCAECDREGCDALGRAAPQVGTGIAGVVAASSDVVADGCQECPLGDAALQIWRADAAVTTEAAAATLLAERQPDVTANVSGRYSQALAPGTYLLCAGANCIGLALAADETLTVNIERRDGPTGFFVGRSDAETPEEDFGFTAP
jgi:hypothetical protein